VRQRIQRYYGRDARVLHPPVDVSRFAPDPSPPQDYFLVASALSGYKRVDLAVDAALRAGVRLVVVGQGPDLDRLRRHAQGGRVEFLPWQSEADLARLFARCQALLFPGVEDFGITPVEVMAAGRPVIARAAGGALETVVPGETGILVDSTQPEEWARVLRQFRANAYEASRLRQHAMRFDRSRFAAGLQRLLQEAWAQRRQLLAPAA
jgi:glycosyltransferase involved in cell wall biosynthesis